MTGGFLDRMAEESQRRLEQARAAVPEEELNARARDLPPAVPLRLSEAGFDVIAEAKRRSPSAGTLADETDLPARVRTYAEAGAVAVSVLTEPTAFAGSLDDLRAASAASPVPTLRKDFLVDPYQVVEAREAGASGVLLIVRILSDRQLEDLLGIAASHGMFALVEAFDDEDLERAERVLRRCPVSPWFPGQTGPALGLPGHVPCLVGANCRDLATLEVDPGRFADLASRFPPGFPRVAESGIERGRDAEHVAGLGYRLALVGTALMRAADPAALLQGLIRAGRSGRGARRHAG